jgi:hypothetical protein
MTVNKQPAKMRVAEWRRKIWPAVGVSVILLAGGRQPEQTSDDASMAMATKADLYRCLFWGIPCVVRSRHFRLAWALSGRWTAGSLVGLVHETDDAIQEIWKHAGAEC